LPTIKLFANLRKLAGQKELSIPGATVNEMLNGLVQLHPALDEAIFENGQIRPQIIITLNGKNITDPNMAVTEADIIAIFPPIAGG
jgi:MoaD family protein